MIANVTGKKEKRTSVIAAYNPHTKELFATYAFEGSTDAKRFNGWIEKCLLPTLQKGQKVIMDNAPFHKSNKTKELIESVGCSRIFQPEYSPDLNPIEKQWSKIKKIYRKFKSNGYKHYEAVNCAFQYQ